MADNIQKSVDKCIIDVDLDFFDDKKNETSNEKLLATVFEIIAKHRDKLSMITISVNDTPGDQLWERRMEQLSIVKDILKLNVPTPIME